MKDREIFFANAKRFNEILGERTDEYLRIGPIDTYTRLQFLTRLDTAPIEVPIDLYEEVEICHAHLKRFGYHSDDSVTYIYYWEITELPGVMWGVRFQKVTMNADRGLC